jgi:CMP-N-acetylneuraminic acid synthetase
MVPYIVDVEKFSENISLLTDRTAYYTMSKELGVDIDNNI